MKALIIVFGVPSSWFNVLLNAGVNVLMILFAAETEKNNKLVFETNKSCRSVCVYKLLCGTGCL